ncbi:MAG: hypothetical protein GY947_17960 [Rhodobacteraceae bacterium]|nr:hypothetical protein [Paracoccaceae bacterium]
MSGLPSASFSNPPALAIGGLDKGKSHVQSVFKIDCMFWRCFMKLVLSMVSALLVSSGTSHAEFLYWYQDGSWDVVSGANKCSATNRPWIEVNFAPYMYLDLAHDIDTSEISVEVKFWPKALREGEKANLRMIRSDDQEISWPAEAIMDFWARSERPLTKEELDFMAEETIVLHFQFSNSHLMTVDASRLRNVLYQLEYCAKGLKSDQQK